MTDLRSLIEVFPAGTKLVVITAELPSGAQVLHVQSKAADGAQVSPVTPSADTSRALSDLDTPSDQLMFERVQRLHRDRGNVALKPREWSIVASLSVREIRRAIGAGALAHAEKEDGRDHGAKVVTAEAMLGYLATVSAVERGSLDPPRWWRVVRGKRAAAA